MRSGLRLDPGTALFQLACLTALGKVVKLLVAKEQLLAGSEHKVFMAIHALECLVLKFHLSVAAADSWARQLLSFFEKYIVIAREGQSTYAFLSLFHDVKKGI